MSSTTTTTTTRPKVLFVLTSQDKLPNGKPTGWYLPEFAHPYYVLAPHCDITMASTRGGTAPLDPSSVEAFKEDKESAKFLQEEKALWEETTRLDEFVGREGEFDGVFYVGGHGPMFDIASSAPSIQIITTLITTNKPVSAVCHGPAAFTSVVLPSGDHLLAHQAVTGFSDAEEETTGLVPEMPFSLQKKLDEASGGKYEKAGEMYGEKVCIGRGGLLITGQNPGSAKATGEALLKALRK